MEERPTTLQSHHPHHLTSAGSATRFATPVTAETVDGTIRLVGPYRSPVQMLEHQQVDGRASIHDSATAASLGLAEAPIEAPTHFSQIDPLAVEQWGTVWFERGCLSCHFRTMVVEGELVQATLTPMGATTAMVEVHTADGTPVLSGTAGIDVEPDDSELGRRLLALGDPGELFVIDRLRVGMRTEQPETVALTRDERNGAGYPFSLAEKLEKITEPHPWYTAEGAKDSPWGRAIVPFEMISVLAHKRRPPWPVRSPVLGLILDLEVALRRPVFVDQPYAVERELVGLSQSRRTESYWTRTTLTDPDSGALVATVLLHSGVFKESYPGYPSSHVG